MQALRTVVSVVVFLAVAGPARAEQPAVAGPGPVPWAGRGKVEGEVLSSQFLPDGSVLFRLQIRNQVIEQGPQLGSPGTFVYNGPVGGQVGRGDVVRLQVNGGVAAGIHVETLDFINNGPVGPAMVGGVPVGPVGPGGLPVPVVSGPAPGEPQGFFRSGRGFLVGALVVFLGLVAAFVAAEGARKRSEPRA